jgi:hypothetical protein
MNAPSHSEPYRTSFAGLEISYQLRPHSTTLDLSHNPLFGPEGLESLFQAIALMIKSEDIPSCALERLVLVNCGLGSSGTPLDQLRLPSSASPDDLMA